MNVSPLGSLTALSPLAPARPGAVNPAGAADGKSFGDKVAKAVGELEDLNKTSDDMAVKASTGRLDDVHDYMIAANQAEVATQLTVAVRNKAVDAFNDIMRMQI